MFGWLESLVSGRSHHAAVRSRVSVPMVKEHHPDVLRRLRRINRDLDYYELPNGDVLLLQYQPGKPRIEIARKALAKPNLSGRPRYERRLQAEGFACLADLRPGSIDSGLIFRVAERVLRKSMKDVDLARAAAEYNQSDEAIHERQVARGRERARSEKSIHGVVFRNRRTFTYAHVAHWPLGAPTRN